MKSAERNKLTIRDIAKAAGVSISTVSRVMNERNDQMTELTRHKVETAIRDLHYVPNRLASSLKHEKSETLGLIVSNIRNPYFSAVARGIQDYAGSAGYDVFICNTDDNPDREAHYLNTLLSRRVEGLVVTTCGQAQSAYERLAANRFPLVLLDRPVAGLRCDSVVVDNHAICQLVIEQLIALGHRHIAIVTPPREDIGPRVDRVEGCRSGMLRHGLELPSDLIVEIGFGSQTIAEAVRILLERQPRPTALFLLNVLLATGVIRELRRQSRLAEFALVTYDDPDWCELLDPPISAVRQPTYEIGRIVARLAIERIANPEKPFERIMLDAEFIARHLQRP